MKQISASKKKVGTNEKNRDKESETRAKRYKKEGEAYWYSTWRREELTNQAKFSEIATI